MSEQDLDRTLDEEVDTPADEETGLAVQKTQNVPRLLVEVNENNEVSHEGEHFLAGKTLALDGPTALALFQAGHVSIRGTVEE